MLSVKLKRRRRRKTKVVKCLYFCYFSAEPIFDGRLGSASHSHCLKCWLGLPELYPVLCVARFVCGVRDHLHHQLHLVGLCVLLLQTGCKWQQKEIQVIRIKRVSMFEDIHFIYKQAPSDSKKKYRSYVILNKFACSKEENVLFNDAINTFYLLLYGVGHMVKDHSDSERGNLLPPLHGQLFSISSMGSFICTIPQTGYHIRWPLFDQSWNTGCNEK